jgi:hypothetical protein
MPIRFKCPLCSTILNVPDAAVGKAGKCNGCGGKIVVPASSEAAPAPLPSASPPSRPTNTAANSTAPSRPASSPPGTVTPPQRNRPANPAPLSIPASAPAEAPQDDYGSLFDQVDVATGNTDDGELKLEPVFHSPVVAYPTSTSEAESSQSYAASASGVTEEQPKGSFQQFIGFGAGSLFCLLLSFGLFMLDTEYSPIPVDMAALEAGTKPTKEYIELGPHLACYSYGVYTAKKRFADFPNAPIEKFTYPIISTTHPAAEKLLEVAQMYGDFGSLPDDVALPMLLNVAAVVTTEEYEHLSDVPRVPLLIERLSGTHDGTVPNIRKLEEGCGIPPKGLNDALNIKPNDKPVFRSSWTSGGVMLFAVASLLFFGLSLLAGYRMIANWKPERSALSERLSSN